MKKTLIIDRKIRLSFLCLGISSLITTEYSLIAAIILLIIYCYIYFTLKDGLMGILLGSINYMLKGIGGGFPGALLIWLSSIPQVKIYSSRIVKISIGILLISLILMGNNQFQMNTSCPFHIKWWCDLGITGILLATCNSMLDLTCLS